jgi:peptidoglycan/xylan/chitin deacetylase (PgdA/CDA1 family)
MGKCRNKRGVHRAAVIGCLLLLAVTAWTGCSFNPNPHSAKEVSGPAGETLKNEAQKSETLEGVDIETIIESERAHVAVHYPRTGNEKVDRAVLEYAQDAITEFEAGINGNTVEEKDEFYMQFEVRRFDKDIVSFKFSSYAYYVGSANGVNGIHTMTFDLSDGKQYALASLFQSDAYLDILSEKTYNGLKTLEIYQSSEGETESLRSGTEPNEKNFENFVLDGSALTIFFKQYQIGSRANQTSQYSIPLAELNDILDTRFRTAAPPPTEPLPSASEAPAADPTPEATEKPTAEPTPEATEEPPAEPTPEPTQNPPPESGEQPSAAPAGIADLTGKLVALTFDDGPHKTLTPRLLDILKQEDVKATFFVLGSRVEYYPDVVKRAADEGHQIGNHTYNHKNLSNLSESDLLNEIRDSAAAIERIIGSGPLALRPPYGAYNDMVKQDAGAPLILWSVDPQDWKYKNADTVYRNATDGVKDGDIILLHDIHKTSVDAVENIIEKLKADGFTFVTVDELIRTRSQAVSGKVYTSLRP